MADSADRATVWLTAFRLSFGQGHPEYLLRKACSEGHLEHLRVVNALWLVPAAVDAFARSWRAKNGRNS
jgi:hypothetical protein